MALEALKQYVAEIEETPIKNEPHIQVVAGEKTGSQVSVYHLNDTPQKRQLEPNISNDYIKKSETLRSEINHDINVGIMPFKTLFKALECISIMTGDETFFKINKEKLLEIQGACLDEDALEIQMEEVSQRLILLQAIENPTPHIKNAIKAHMKKQDELADLCIKSRESR